MVNPFSKYVNVELVGIEPRFGATSNLGTILLDNAKAITYNQMREEVEKVFGIYGCHYELFVKGKKIDEKTNISSLNGSLVRAVKIGVSPQSVKEPVLASPACRFINVQKGDSKGTVLLENPQGSFTLEHTTLREKLELLYPKSQFLLPPVSVLQLNGFTLQTKN